MLNDTTYLYLEYLNTWEHVQEYIYNNSTNINILSIVETDDQIEIDKLKYTIVYTKSGYTGIKPKTSIPLRSYKYPRLLVDKLNFLEVEWKVHSANGRKVYPIPDPISNFMWTNGDNLNFCPLVILKPLNFTQVIPELIQYTLIEYELCSGLPLLIDTSFLNIYKADTNYLSLKLGYCMSNIDDNSYINLYTKIKDRLLKYINIIQMPSDIYLSMYFKYNGKKSSNLIKLKDYNRGKLDFNLE